MIVRMTWDMCAINTLMLRESEVESGMGYWGEYHLHRKELCGPPH